MKYTINELINILTIIKSIKSYAGNINIDDLIDLFNTEINK